MVIAFELFIDMCALFQGMKTVANDLDNARVWFDNVQLPKSALLNKFCDINENNEYVQKGEKMRIEVFE